MQEINRDLTDRVERLQVERDDFIRQMAALERKTVEAEARRQQAEKVKDDIEKKIMKVGKRR
jgi:hypothetical protein